jgi:hypothetical protein
MRNRNKYPDSNCFSLVTADRTFDFAVADTGRGGGDGGSDAAGAGAATATPEPEVAAAPAAAPAEGGDSEEGAPLVAAAAAALLDTGHEGPDQKDKKYGVRAQVNMYTWFLGLFDLLTERKTIPGIVQWTECRLAWKMIQLLLALKKSGLRRCGRSPAQQVVGALHWRYKQRSDSEYWK